MKKLFTLLLCVAMLLSCGVNAFAAEGRFSHFLGLHEWHDDTFRDISRQDWYYDNVVTAYRMGLISGNGDGSFNPKGNITLAESIKLAACINSLYRTADTRFENSEPWYRSYVDYALTQGIITGEFGDYERPATRAEFATILFHALPVRCFEEINTVENGAIPDVPYKESYAGAVYRLYRAGVLTGDSQGAFHPGDHISRCEAVAVVGRIMMESDRKSVTLTTPLGEELSGEEIFAKCSPAVFYIEMYNEQGKKTANGSGFFINSDGTAVTCWHVLEHGVSAKISIASTGKVYDLVGVYDYDVDKDWAVIQIDGSGFDYLDIGDEKTDVGGASVFALGSPLGLQNTITQGLICNPTRVEDMTRYILFSAAISSGSSGGALINKYGDVIGITAATYVYGQNLNLAINMSYIDEAHRSNVRPLSEIQQEILEEQNEKFGKRDA